MNISEILAIKFPSVDFTKDVILQDDGKGPYIVKWDESLGPKPDQKTLDKWEIEIAPIKARNDARENRRTEYPAIGDQLDAILKYFNDLEIKGIPLPADLKTVKDQWLAVKLKYPLPE